LTLLENQQLQKIQPESYLSLSFSYFNDNAKTVWDVVGVSLSESIHDQTQFSVTRRMSPDESLPDIGNIFSLSRLPLRSGGGNRQAAPASRVRTEKIRASMTRL